MKLPFRFKPTLVACLRDYDAKTFSADLSAGVTIGIIALPMAMAFAIASNIPPAVGIVTAIIAGVLSAVFGGTKLSVSGPTGAFVSIVGGVAASYGFSGLLVCTMMAGVMLFLMGLARFGGLIRFIPAPLVRGFTTGIAVIILCGQLRDFLGISAETGNPANVLLLLRSLVPHLADLNVPSFVLAVVCLAGILFWPRHLSRYVPGSIVMMILATLVAYLMSLFFGWEVATIGSRFGGIPREIAAPSLPDFDLEVFQKLLAPALTIAMLGAIESLLCATAADGMTDDNHDPDQELMAQGIANFVVPFFGGIPSTGAIARTAANIRSGGKTPVAAVIHSIFLLLVMLVAAPLARYVPLAVLSAILIVVAINMGDWKEFIHLYRYPKSDATVFLFTFLLTIIFGLTQAVSVGMLLACVFFIRRMSSLSRVGIMHLHPHHREELPAGWIRGTRNEMGATCEDPSSNDDEASDDIVIVNVSGAMFFGAAQKLKSILLHLGAPPKAIILKMERVISLDATATLTLEDIIAKCNKKRVPVFISGLNKYTRHMLIRAGLLSHLSRHNIFTTAEAALAKAKEVVDGAVTFEDLMPHAVPLRPLRRRRMKYRLPRLH